MELNRISKYVDDLLELSAVRGSDAQSNVYVALLVKGSRHRDDYAIQFFQIHSLPSFRRSGPRPDISQQ